MTARAALLAIVLIVVLTPPVRAQLVSTLDVGASSTSYENDHRSEAMSVSPMLQWNGRAASLFAVGSLTRFETGELGSSGMVAASLLSPGIALLEGLRGELAMGGGGSAHEDLTRSARLTGQLRLHLTRRARGAWIGGGGGRTWDGEVWRTLASFEAGGWWRHGPLLATLSAAPSGTSDVTWTDLTAGGRWTRSAVELGGTLGYRAGDAASDPGAWAGVDALWWLGRHIALSASAGSHRVDHAQAAPGGRYLTLGLRFASRPPALELLHAGDRTFVAELAQPVAGRLTLGGTAERRTIRIEAPRAGSVEIMGDFTEWKAVRLTRARGSSWEIILPLVPGNHRFNVRVDEGDWGVPDGVTAITDDFGGVVGILITP